MHNTSPSASDNSSRPAEHPERHETSELQVRPLIIFGITVLILGVVFQLILYGMFEHFENGAKYDDAPQADRANARPTPPEPRLQGLPGFHENLPSRDMAQMREAQEKILKSGGPTGEAGFVRIPIERAMELIVERERGKNGKE